MYIICAKQVNGVTVTYCWSVCLSVIHWRSFLAYDSYTISRQTSWKSLSRVSKVLSSIAAFSAPPPLSSSMIAPEQKHRKEITQSPWQLVTWSQRWLPAQGLQREGSQSSKIGNWRRKQLLSTHSIMFQLQSKSCSMECFLRLPQMSMATWWGHGSARPDLQTH